MSRKYTITEKRRKADDSLRRKERNAELYKDYLSKKFSVVDLVVKYRISSARIFQIINKQVELQGVPGLSGKEEREAVSCITNNIYPEDIKEILL